MEIHDLYEDFCEHLHTTLQAEHDLQNVEWSTGDNTDMIEITVPGVYWVRASENGCSATDTIVVEKCCPDSARLFPNVITPTRRDGINDVFRLIDEKFVPLTVDVEVFNRWGRRVFRSADPGFGWDGTENGKTRPGVYYYSITINRRCRYHGSVTVI